MSIVNNFREKIINFLKEELLIVCYEIVIGGELFVLNKVIVERKEVQNYLVLKKIVVIVVQQNYDEQKNLGVADLVKEQNLEDY